MKKANRRIGVILGCLLMLPLLSYAQETNELPMYGRAPKNEKQIKADEIFIEAATKAAGSREVAARHAIQRGFEYLNRADRSTAMKRFNQAWLLTPDNPHVFWGFGSALQYYGKFEEGEGYFKKADDLEPGNHRLLCDFGFFYQNWADKRAKDSSHREALLHKSIELFQKAQTYDSSYDRIYANWAISLCYLGDYKGAWLKIKEAESRGGKSIDPRFVKDLEEKMARP